MKMPSLLLVAYATVLLAAVAVTATSPMGEFVKFTQQYGKEYADLDEFHHRFGVFRDNLKLIDQIQSLEMGTATYGVNEFADLTEDEFHARYLMPSIGWQDAKNSCLAHGVTFDELDFYTHIPVQDLPTSVDWREKGAVSPVKNQGGCGSCWAFSTTGNIEGQWFLAGHSLTELSEQYLVDCDHTCCFIEDGTLKVCNAGCGGGWPWSAYVYVMEMEGIPTETAYPYTGVDGTCQASNASVAATIKNYTCIPNDEDEVASYLVQHGPVSIAMNAGWLQFYLGGISDPLFCSGSHLDHAILIVGYGEEGEKPYWIIKNSWGDHWGEKGYFKLIRGKNKCGVANAPSSAIVA